MAKGDKIRFRQGTRASVVGTAKEAGQLLFATYEDEVLTASGAKNLVQGDIYFDLSGGTNGVRVNLANDVDKARTLFSGETKTSDNAGQWNADIEGVHELYDGLTLVLRLNSGNNKTYNTLNINGYGNKLVWYRKGTKLTTHMSSGSEVLLVYRLNAGSYTVPSTNNPGLLPAGSTVQDGWVLLTSYDSGNTNTVPTAYSTTAADTAAKVATCTNYNLQPNSYLHFLISTTNSAANALTLNINSKGAKPIYINGSASSSSNYNIPAGSYILYYDGTAYQLRTDGVLPGSILNAKTADALKTTGKLTISLSSDAKPTYTNGGDITAGISGVLAVPHGGTGAYSLSSGALLQGNGVDAISAASAKGSATLPIYIDSNGKPQTITSYSGNAATATKLAASKTIATKGMAKGTATAFDGSANISIPITEITLSGKVDDITPVVKGTLAVANGGTGATSLTSGVLLQGNGTSAISKAAAAGSASVPIYIDANGKPQAITSYSGKATSAGKLDPGAKISITGGATAAGVTFTGASDITLEVTEVDMTKATNALAVNHGGTGAKTLPSGALLQGNGTSAISKATAKGKATLPIYIDAGGKPQTITSYEGKSASADKLATARTIAISGGVTGTATSFDGSGNITIPVTTVVVGDNNNVTISGKLAVSHGGTGRNTLTTNATLVGNAQGQVKMIAAASGAYYSTGANVEPKFGTLPVAQGGTGVTSIENIQAGKDGSGNVITSTYATKTEMNNLLATADAMIFKGVVDKNTDLPAEHNAGWTYKVANAGTYAGMTCEVGDLIICVTDGTSANNAHWHVIQNNIDGAVTGPTNGTVADGQVAVFNGITGKIIKGAPTVGSNYKPIWLNKGVPTAWDHEAVGAWDLSGAQDLNTKYDAGIYSIEGGSVTNYPANGSKYAAMLVVPYRKSSGNDRPDYAWQMSTFTQDLNALWFRTSGTRDTWNGWRNVVNIPANEAVGNSGQRLIYTDANGILYNSDKAIGAPNHPVYVAGGNIMPATVGDSFISYGGQNFSGTFSPLDAVYNHRIRANRFAGIPGSAITIQYSADGGSSWTNYTGFNDLQKTTLFTTRGSSLRLVPSGNVTTNSQLRIIVDTSIGKVYTNLKKLMIYVSTNYSTNPTVTIEAALQDAPESYTKTICQNQNISGWSGWNIINCDFITYGNDAGSQYGRIRFTFKHTGVSSGKEANGLIVTSIYGYGGVGWTTPSTLALTDHLYSFDGALNATFPANVTSTKFIGPIADYNNSTPVKFGYSTEGMNTTSWIGSWDTSTAGEYRLRAISPAKLRAAMGLGESTGILSTGKGGTGYGKDALIQNRVIRSASSGSQMIESNIAIDANGNSIYPNTDGGGSLGSYTKRWTEIHGKVLKISGPSSNPALDGGARIEFSYDASTSTGGSQPVYISYTPNDSYRSPAGLKIMGGTSATPAWFEVEGAIYSSGIIYANNTTESSSVSTGSLIAAGGVGIAKKLYVGGATTLSSSLTVSGATKLNSKLAVTGAGTFDSTVLVKNLLTLYRESTTETNTPAGITFQNKNTTTNTTNTGQMYYYHTTNNYNGTFVISSTGSTIIGGGEGAADLYNTIKPADSENMYIMTNATNFIESGEGSSADRAGIGINKSSVFPVKAEVATNNTISIGTNAARFNWGYFTNISLTNLRALDNNTLWFTDGSSNQTIKVVTTQDTMQISPYKDGYGTLGAPSYRWGNFYVKQFAPDLECTVEVTLGAGNTWVDLPLTASQKKMIDPGTNIIQLYDNTRTTGAITRYLTYWSGVFSWLDTYTNGSAQYSEIPLHGAGHSLSTIQYQLRVVYPPSTDTTHLASSGDTTKGGCYFQIKRSNASAAAPTGKQSIRVRIKHIM